MYRKCVTVKQRYSTNRPINLLLTPDSDGPRLDPRPPTFQQHFYFFNKVKQQNFLNKVQTKTERTDQMAPFKLLLWIFKVSRSPPNTIPISPDNLFSLSLLNY